MICLVMTVRLNILYTVDIRVLEIRLWGRGFKYWQCLINMLRGKRSDCKSLSQRQTNGSLVSNSWISLKNNQVNNNKAPTTLFLHSLPFILKYLTYKKIMIMCSNCSSLNRCFRFHDICSQCWFTPFKLCHIQLKETKCVLRKI